MVVLMLSQPVLAAPIMAVGGIIMALRLNVPLSGVILAAVPSWASSSQPRGDPRPAALQVDAEEDRPGQPGHREALSGVRVIRAFDRIGYEEQRFEAANVTSPAPP